MDIVKKYGPVKLEEIIIAAFCCKLQDGEIEKIKRNLIKREQKEYQRH